MDKKTEDELLNALEGKGMPPNQTCTKPDCDCVKQYELKHGEPPKYGYPCLGPDLEKIEELKALKRPPSPAIEGKEEDRDWEAKEIRRRIDEQKSENSTSALIERAFVVGYFNRPDPPADYVKDVASGHLTEAWERCKPALRLSPTSPSGAEGEGEKSPGEEFIRWAMKHCKLKEVYDQFEFDNDATSFDTFYQPIINKINKIFSEHMTKFETIGTQELWDEFALPITTDFDEREKVIHKYNFSILMQKVLSAAKAKIVELEAELAGAIQSGRNIVDQNCALLKERDGFTVSWNTREKMLDEVVRQRDALQEEVNKWQENYSMIAATLNDRVAEVNSLKEWIDSHR